jgi:hypothetical protein
MANGIDLSGLPVAPPDAADLLIQTSTASSGGDWITDAQNVAITAAVIGYFFYDRRPRGSVRNDLVEIKRSSIPGAELGVFAKTYIPEGTLIGEYPGYIREPSKVFDRKKTEEAKEKTKKYLWEVSDEVILDPTDSTGRVPIELQYLFGLVKIDTTLCRVNEPPKGSDVNVFTEIEGANTVRIVSERNIFAGEEIFLDYGLKYDRSDYSAKDEDKEKTEQMKLDRKREVLEDMTFQPIDRSEGESVDEDTSMPNTGFLSKLKDKDKSLNKVDGILNPEEASELFTEMGSSMFGSDEDRYVI